MTTSPGGDESQRGRSIGQWILLVGAVTVATQLLFLTGVVLSELVPDRAITESLSVSVDDGQFGPDYPLDGIGGIHDGFTQCLALGSGVGAPRDLSLFSRGVYSAQLGPCEEAVDKIEALQSGAEVVGWNYARYWHGYVALTRPVLALAGVEPLHALVTLFFVTALLFLTYAGSLRWGWPAVAVLVTPVLASSNLLTTPAHAFTHALSWCVIFAATGATTVVTARWGWRIGLGAVALGAALFNYIDLLTTPASAWSLAVFACVATALTGGASLREATKALLASGATWPAAYAVTWCAKWVFAAAALGLGFFREVDQVARFRLAGEGDGVSLAWGASTQANVLAWWGTVATSRLVLPAAVAVVAICLTLIIRRGRRADVGRFALLSAPAWLVIAWFEVFKNHSQVHAFFTYRSVPLALGILMAAGVLAVRLIAAPGKQEAAGSTADSDPPPVPV